MLMRDQNRCDVFLRSRPIVNGRSVFTDLLDILVSFALPSLALLPRMYLIGFYGLEPPKCSEFFVAARKQNQCPLCKRHLHCTAYKRMQDVVTTCVLTFKSCKCIKIRLRPGFRPGPRWGSLQRSPDPSCIWGGEVMEGMEERKGKGRDGGRGEGRGEKGRGGEGRTPSKNPGYGPAFYRLFSVL